MSGLETIPIAEPWIRLDQAVVLPNTVAVLLTTLREDEGIAAPAVLEGTGLTETAVLDPDTRLTSRQILQVCSQAMAASHNLMLAVGAGQRMHAAACGPYGFALLSSASHAEVLVNIHRYHRLLSPFVGMQFATSAKASQCTLTLHPEIDRQSTLAAFVMEFKVSGMRSVMQSLYGPGLQLEGVRFRGPRPAHAKALEKAWGCLVSYGQNDDAVLLPARLLELRPAMPDPVANVTMKRLCDQMRVAPQQDDILAALEQLLARQSQVRNLGAASKLLGCGVRTLQRRLAKAGTSFREVQDRLRMRGAIDQLKSTRLSVEAIALELGYTDVSNFRHAFVRWTGKSPSAFRTEKT